MRPPKTKMSKAEVKGYILSLDIKHGSNEDDDIFAASTLAIFDLLSIEYDITG